MLPHAYSRASQDLPRPHSVSRQDKTDERSHATAGLVEAEGYSSISSRYPKALGGLGLHNGGSPSEGGQARRGRLNAERVHAPESRRTAPGRPAHRMRHWSKRRSLGPGDSRDSREPRLSHHLESGLARSIGHVLAAFLKWSYLGGWYLAFRIDKSKSWGKCG